MNQNIDDASDGRSTSDTLITKDTMRNLVKSTT